MFSFLYLVQIFVSFRQFMICIGYRVIFGLYWPFWDIIGHSGHFELISAISGHFELILVISSLSDSAVLGHLSHHYFSTLFDKIYNFPPFFSIHFWWKEQRRGCVVGDMHLWEHGLADFSTLALKYFSTFAFYLYLWSTSWPFNYILEGMHRWKCGFARSVQLHWNILFVFWQSTILFKACACGSMGLPGPSTD